MTDQLPPSKHSVVMRERPVANSCPTGQENVTIVPNVVSRLDASAPNPGCNAGQSEICYHASKTHTHIHIESNTLLLYS